MLKKLVAVLAACTIFFITGCKDEAPPERIRILGSSPVGGSIGSELRAELGIDGGDGPYQFTLSNQPGWLAVEYNDNPLRPGVIIRGIPGVTGGQTVDDLITVVYENIVLTVSDGKSVATREFLLDISPNGLTIDTNSRQEAEQEDRPVREVFNENTRKFDPVNIALCSVDADGVPAITEEDMTYWLDLIDRFEVLEAGGTLTEAEAAELTAVFGNFRPRLAYLNLQVSAAVVADSLFGFVISEANISAAPGQDYMTSIRRANGETLDLAQGFLKLPAGEAICPIPFFINDDREAEDKESLSIKVNNISTHNYLPTEILGTLEIADNEPTPGFLTKVGTVTKSSSQKGFDSELQAPGTIYKMTVVMNEVPLQDKTADHTAVARLVFKTTAGSGDFATVGGPEEVAGSTADVVVDTSPAYVTAIEGGVEVAFFMDTREEDGETITEWVTERDLYFYAPAKDDSDALVDNFVSLTWDRSPTSFENQDLHTIHVNEWVTTVERVLPLDSRAVALRSSADGGVYVGYEYDEDGITVVDIVHYDRLGQVEITLPLRFADHSISLADFVVREKGIPSVNSFIPDIAQDLFVTLNVNVLLAPPAVPNGTDQLGGQDFVVGLYRRVNRIGGFDLVWNRQLGSAWNDVATSTRLNSANNLYVTGVTEGQFGSFTNNGGTDAFIMLLDDNGVVLNSRLYGTEGDDAFLDMTLDGAFNALFVGYAGSATELGASGGGLDILTASFSDELAVRRVSQFGGEGSQVMNSVEALDVGFFAAGTTDNSRLGFSAGQKDVLISYQRTASQLDATFEIGTPGEDIISEVTTIGLQGIAAGSTEGSLFEGNLYGGGKDWWMASYNVIRPDPTDSFRTLELAWQIQGGDSRNEVIRSLNPTDFGKLFKLTEIDDGTSRLVRVIPFALTDGRELSVLP